MTFIPTPNAARVVIQYHRGTEEFSNVLHFAKTDFTSGDLDNLASAIDLWVGDTFMINITQDVTYDATTAYDIRTSTGEVRVLNDSATNGSAMGDVLPLNVALCITLYTASRGRSGRGRVYLAGLDEGHITDGYFTASATQLGLDYVNGIMGVALGVGWTLVIRSVQQDGVPLTTAVTRPVTTVAVRDNKVATQRRRVDRI
jgi:hypothetical protein